jgi:hypothetical protein
MRPAHARGRCTASRRGRGSGDRAVWGESQDVAGKRHRSNHLAILLLHARHDRRGLECTPAPTSSTKRLLCGASSPKLCAMCRCSNLTSARRCPKRRPPLGQPGPRTGCEPEGRVSGQAGGAGPACDYDRRRRRQFDPLCSVLRLTVMECQPPRIMKALAVTVSLTPDPSREGS